MPQENDKSQNPVGIPILTNEKTLKVPASKARITFVANSADMRSYYAVHQLAFKQLTGKKSRHTYIVDKAVFVLVASLWEAYCEDIVTECLDYLTSYAPSYSTLPPTLISEIEKSVRSGNSSPWVLAGDGWRDYIRQRREGFERRRNKHFASPKSESVEEFFQHVLGIENLREKWQSMGYSEICEVLDKNLDIRNVLVHRITPGRIVHKREVKKFYFLVWHLAMYTDSIVDDMIIKATGKSRWRGHVGASGEDDIVTDADDPAPNS